MTATETDDATDERSTDKRPAYGSPRISITDSPFDVTVRDEETVGRAELDTEVWWGSRTAETKLYLHAAGELMSGGEFSFGTVMNYRQARRLRDRLDDALAQLERDG